MMFIHIFHKAVVKLLTFNRFQFWNQLVLKLFVKMYHIRLDEAEKPLSDYRTLNEFFVRKLKPGVRQIDRGPNALTSPVDGTIIDYGFLDHDTVFKAKSSRYNIQSMLIHQEYVQTFTPCYFINIHLSPQNYHRFHSPADGAISRLTHIPGKYYPVNALGRFLRSDLYSANERVMMQIETDTFGSLMYIAVGACVVGGIKINKQPPVHVSKGDELGYFEIGSTIILLIENRKTLTFERIHKNMKVQFGNRLL